MSTAQQIASTIAASAARSLGVVLEHGGAGEIDAISSDIGNGAAQLIALDPIAMLVAAARLLGDAVTATVQPFSDGGVEVRLYCSTEQGFADISARLGLLPAEQFVSPSGDGTRWLRASTTGGVYAAAIGSTETQVVLNGPRITRSEV